MNKAATTNDLDLPMPQVGFVAHTAEEATPPTVAEVDEVVTDATRLADSITETFPLGERAICTPDDLENLPEDVKNGLIQDSHCLTGNWISIFQTGSWALAAIEGAMACSYVVALAKSNHLLNDCIAGIGIGMGFLAAISTKLADHLKEGNKKIMETVFESGIAIDLPEELEAMLRAALESHRAAQLEA